MVLNKHTSSSMDFSFICAYKILSTAKEGKQLFVESDQSHIRRKSNPLESEITAVSELNSAIPMTKNHSQSATSSPQKQVRDMKRLRAHSDTSLHKVGYHYENMPMQYPYEPPRGKTNNVVSDQVRHKLTCTDTEKS